MTENRRQTIDSVSASLLIVMEDMLGYASQLEEARCKADAERLRRLACRLENQIYSLREKASP